jgi:hypothetical protein
VDVRKATIMSSPGMGRASIAEPRARWPAPDVPVTSALNHGG